MAKVRQIGMAVGTFSVALGIGFVMQNGDALANRFGAEASGDRQAPFTDAQVVTAAFEAEIQDPAPEAIVLSQAFIAPSVSAPQPDTTLDVTLPQPTEEVEQAAPVQLAALETDTPLEPPQTPEVIAETDCTPAMKLSTGQVATIIAAITAPCHADTAFTIHHQGMMFTVMTDDAGSAMVTVPALAPTAVLIAAFEDGEGAVDSITVPDFATYDRAVLQWQGDTAVILSAYEDGAGFGDPGHIHVDNPGDLSRVAQATGGALLQLGDPAIADAFMAQVYTFPSGTAQVMLVAEAEITAQNCDQELNAQSLQFTPDGQSSALDLELIMPACDAVGDFLVLQNMFKDLTLASR